MASNIFRQMEKEGGLFRNETALLPEFLPEQLPGREGQIQEMASYLAVAAKGIAPQSIVMSGPPGTGKTTSSKLLLKQLCEVSSKPMPIYINCWECNTRLGVLMQIISSAGSMLPRRGIAADEVAATLKEIGKKSGSVFIIVLDEVDRLVAAKEAGVLYDLARAGETYGMKASVVAITNDEQFMVKIDGRIRSSLAGKVVEFKAYAPGELKGILNERAKMAFFPNSLDAEVVPLCAAVGAKNGGDARIALQLLWAAGKRAEREGKKKVGVEDVKMEKDNAVEIAGTPAERKKGMLDEFDQKLAALVQAAGKNGIDGFSIYSKMKADESMARTIRNRLAKLEGAMLIRSEENLEGSGHGKKYFVVGK